MSAIAIVKDLPDWLKNQNAYGSKEWHLYSLRARLLLTLFRLRWFGRYDPQQFQIDHRFSIKAGWINGVPLKVITNRNNLVLMPKAYNRQKGCGSSITLAELYADYIPDNRVNRFVKTLLRVDDEDTLNRWALTAYNYFKQIATIAA